jgi:hypothetical protein
MPHHIGLVRAVRSYFTQRLAQERATTGQGHFNQCMSEAVSAQAAGLQVGLQAFGPPETRQCIGKTVEQEYVVGLETGSRINFHAFSTLAGYRNQLVIIGVQESTDGQYFTRQLRAAKYFEIGAEPPPIGIVYRRFT